MFPPPPRSCMSCRKLARHQNLSRENHRTLSEKLSLHFARNKTRDGESRRRLPIWLRSFGAIAALAGNSR